MKEDILYLLGAGASAGNESTNFDFDTSNQSVLPVNKNLYSLIIKFCSHKSSLRVSL